MPSAEVLIVEDDAEMAAVLCQGFEQDRHTVTIARDGAEGLRMARERKFEAIVLDVMLPLLDGYEVATELRRAGDKTPILMLTARDSVTDIVRGFDCGVEDYLTKPFSFLELSARVRTLIRRGQPQLARLQVGDLVLNVDSCETTRDGRDIHLTKTEFRVLELLLRNAGHVVRRGDLLRAVWGSASAGAGNNLDVTISALRTKVDRGGGARLIHTVRGFGYKVAES